MGGHVVDPYTQNLHRLQGFAKSLGNRYLSASYPLQLLALVLIVVAKNGFGLSPAGGEGVLRSVANLPRPTNYESASVGPIFMARILQIDSLRGWLLLVATMTLVSLCVIFIRFRGLEIYQRSLLLLVLMSSTATASVTQHVGNYDWMTFLGATLLSISPTRRIAALAALIMALGNPEQAIVACLCLLVLSLTSQFANYRSRALVALGTSGLVATCVYLWMLAFGMRESRLGLLPFFLPTALDNFLRNPIGNIWSWFGPAWFLIIASLILIRLKKVRIVVLCAVVLLPAFFTIITADGTRVFSLVSLPAMLVLAMWFVHQIGSSKAPPALLLGLYIVVWTVTPTLLNTFTWTGTLFGHHLKPLLVMFLNSNMPFV